MGRETRELAGRLAESAYVSPDQLAALQFEKLKTLLAIARSSCPYYQSSDYLAADSIESLTDVNRLPLIDRPILRRHAEDMCRQPAPVRRLRDQTRGSTGERLVYFWDRHRQAWDKANRLRGHAWHGFDTGDRELHLWPIDPPVDFGGRCRLAVRRGRDAILGECQVDSLSTTDLEPDLFWRRVGRFDPDCMTAFPSALAEVIQRDPAAARQARLPSLRAIFLTGEVLHPWQRALIGQTLRASCFESYGVQEAGAIAYECPNGAWHLCAESVLVEFLLGNRAARPGELAEVVVTGLESHSMPLIRYRTGDIVRYDDRECGCGLTLPTMPPVLGRVPDFMIADDGAWIEPLRCVEALESVLIPGRFQVRQNEIGAITILLVDHHAPADGLPGEVGLALSSLFGHRVACSFERTARLQRTEFGKCRYVCSSRATARESRDS